jgi:hypothetical protein
MENYITRGCKYSYWTVVGHVYFMVDKNVLEIKLDNVNGYSHDV